MATEAQAKAALDERGAAINRLAGVEGVGIGVRGRDYFIKVYPVRGRTPRGLPQTVDVTVSGVSAKVRVELDRG